MKVIVTELAVKGWELAHFQAVGEPYDVASDRTPWVGGSGPRRLSRWRWGWRGERTARPPKRPPVWIDGYGVSTLGEIRDAIEGTQPVDECQATLDMW
jgi:hypothetical protein